MNPGVIRAGAPSIGTDPTDDHIWYYNGTSAAQVLVALDYVLPNYAKFHTPDLVISGPNAGWTLGPFVYTLSGAMGATIAAVERGIPTVAFSSGNSDPAPFSWVNASTKVGLQDPATITARLATSLVQSMIDKAAGSPLLPKGYGMTVNMPYITSFASDKCTNPPFMLTRMGANTANKVAFDQKTGLFDVSADTAVSGPGGHVLPTERDVINSQCLSSVTLFTVQYDTSFHGQCINISDVTAVVPLVVHINGSTPPVGALGPNATVVVIGNVSHPQAPAPSSPQPSLPTITGFGVKTQWSMSALMLGLGVAAFVL